MRRTLLALAVVATLILGACSSTDSGEPVDAGEVVSRPAITSDVLSDFSDTAALITGIEEATRFTPDVLTEHYGERGKVVAIARTTENKSNVHFFDNDVEQQAILVELDATGVEIGWYLIFRDGSRFVGANEGSELLVAPGDFAIIVFGSGGELDYTLELTYN